MHRRTRDTGEVSREEGVVSMLISGLGNSSEGLAIGAKSGEIVRAVKIFKQNQRDEQALWVYRGIGGFAIPSYAWYHTYISCAVYSKVYFMVWYDRRAAQSFLVCCVVSPISGWL